MQLHANDRIVGKYLSLRSRAGSRDENMRIVSAIRRGAFDEAFPKKYSSEWPKPTIANTIDVAARDAAEMLAPLPSFNCSSANMADESARRVVYWIFPAGTSTTPSEFVAFHYRTGRWGRGELEAEAA